MYDQHHHQHQHKHQHENLTDAHHAWTWGAVWRGGEGGDLVTIFLNIFWTNLFFFFLLFTWGIWISCFIWIGFEPFQCWLVLLLGKEIMNCLFHQIFCQSLPEGAWGAVSSIHIGKAWADHRMTRHLTSLTSQSLQGRVVTVGELKKEKKVF